MGQYWKPVNLTKREYIHPHRLNVGLKLLEQASSPNMAGALTILLAAMPVKRGGGDFKNNQFIGRWAGDVVTFVGDYSANEDFTNSPVPFDLVYECCGSDTDVTDPETGWTYKPFTDVTDDVLEIMRENGMIGDDGDKPKAEQPF